MNIMQVSNVFNIKQNVHLALILAVNGRKIYLLNNLILPESKESALLYLLLGGEASSTGGPILVMA